MNRFQLASGLLAVIFGILGAMRGVAYDIILAFGKQLPESDISEALNIFCVVFSAPLIIGGCILIAHAFPKEK